MVAVLAASPGSGAVIGSRTRLPEAMTPTDTTMSTPPKSNDVVTGSSNNEMRLARNDRTS